MAYGGVGVSLGGIPIEGIGGARLDGRRIIAYDTDLNLIGFFSYAESVETIVGGLNLFQVAEGLGSATKWYRPPGISRYGDLSLGWGSKRISSGYFVDHVTLHDVGVMIRVTPYNTIQHSGLWSHMDRRIAVRLDVAHGRSTQNEGDGALFSWATARIEPIPELTRRSWAAHAAIAIPGEMERSLRRGRFGWLFEFLNPAISVGGSWDRIRPTRRDPSTGTTTAGPWIRRSGWEVTLGGVFSLRGGRVEDMDAGIEGTTSGFGARVEWRDVGGFRYDQARIPGRPGEGSLRQEAFSVFLNPVGLWRRVR